MVDYNAEKSFINCRLTKTVGYNMKVMHIHDVYEIFMSLSDGVSFFVNDRMYLLKRGDVMLFTNNDLHKVSIPDVKIYKRYVITFSPEIMMSKTTENEDLLSCFEEGQNVNKKFELTESEQEKFRALADKIQKTDENTEFGKVEKWLDLAQILLLLCKVKSGRNAPLWVPEKNRKPYTAVITKYIDENYMYDISLDGLSQKCFLNKSYLCRVFKENTGFCIHDYINYRRLSNAMQLLRKGKSVGEAARLSGFSSDTFFITVFKNNIGITPYKYALKFKN